MPKIKASSFLIEMKNTSQKARITRKTKQAQRMTIAIPFRLLVVVLLLAVCTIIGHPVTGSPVVIAEITTNNDTNYTRFTMIPPPVSLKSIQTLLSLLEIGTPPPGRRRNINDIRILQNRVIHHHHHHRPFTS